MCLLGGLGGDIQDSLAPLLGDAEACKGAQHSVHSHDECAHNECPCLGEKELLARGLVVFGKIQVDWYRERQIDIAQGLGQEKDETKVRFAS